MPLQPARARQDRPRPVPDRDGRHRAGRQSRRHQAAANWPSTARRSPRSSSARSRTGTTRRSRSSTRTPSCRRRRSRVVHRSDGSGTTFIFTNYLSKVSADWKSKVGSNTVGRMAGRHRRQGQRRRRQQRRQHQGLDRLRRIRLRQAEQADHDQDDQQGRQDRRADAGAFHGGRGQRRLGNRSPASA